MSIKEALYSDLKETMRAKDAKKLGVLRLISAAVKQVEVDERIEVDDSRMSLILTKMAKQRNESIAQFETANRMDLVEQEKYELELINHYLPEPLAEAEVTAMIDKAISELGAVSISDMGKVMTMLKPILQGRTDMSKVSAEIKRKLS